MNDFRPLSACVLKNSRVRLEFRGKFKTEDISMVGLHRANCVHLVSQQKGRIVLGMRFGWRVSIIDREEDNEEERESCTILNRVLCPIGQRESVSKSRE